jgi:hypothetical protein
LVGLLGQGSTYGKAFSYTERHKHREERGHMLRIGFEPTISVFECSNIVHSGHSNREENFFFNSMLEANQRKVQNPENVICGWSDWQFKNIFAFKGGQNFEEDNTGFVVYSASRHSRSWCDLLWQKDGENCSCCTHVSYYILQVIITRDFWNVGVLASDHDSSLKAFHEVFLSQRTVLHFFLIYWMCRVWHGVAFYISEIEITVKWKFSGSVKRK